MHLFYMDYVKIQRPTHTNQQTGHGLQTVRAVVLHCERKGVDDWLNGRGMPRPYVTRHQGQSFWPGFSQKAHQKTRLRIVDAQAG